MEKEPQAQGPQPLAQQPPVQQEQPEQQQPPVVDWEAVARTLESQEKASKEGVARAAKACEDATAQALKGFQEIMARIAGKPGP